ncbi:MAG: hypothetical protein IKG93_06830 [Clostridiales bacterium]|nr:hypothetical protein [Clostridiales bacterium]
MKLEGKLRVLAVLYLVFCVAFGVSLVRVLIPDVRGFFRSVSGSSNLDFLPNAVFTIPAGLVVGLLTTSVFSYYVTLMLAKTSSSSSGLRATGLAITVTVFSAFSILNILLIRKKHSSRGVSSEPEKNAEGGISKYASNRKNNTFYAVVIGIFTLLSAYLMLDSLLLSNGILKAGGAAFSDLASHTALTSSFSKGFNFPTQYPFFSNDGIQYHFLFYYLCGTLEYLGLPVDWAINLPSILSMVSMLVLFGTLAALLSKRRGGFVLAPVLILFRSSFNFIMQFAETFSQSHSPIHTIVEMLTLNEYYGKTKYEDWGVWTINIYGNQRHLMLGLAALVLLILLVLPYVREMLADLSSDEKTGAKVKCFFFGKRTWLPSQTAGNGPWRTLALALPILVSLPYFHGSMLVSVLLVLAVLAVFSRYRLIYLAMAVFSVLSSVLQTRLFAGEVSSVFSPKLKIGFYANPSFFGIISYLVAITGLTMILAFVFAGIRAFRKSTSRSERWFFPVFLLASMAPLIFAFSFQLTSELLTNHKIIQVSIMLLDVFVACLLLELWNFVPKSAQEKQSDAKPDAQKALESKKKLCRALVAVLMVPLTFTAVFEWASYGNLNDYKWEIKDQSEAVRWICENTDPDTVFLTPSWSYSDFFRAGRPAYLAYPYYSWSAGHDLYGRQEIYFNIIDGFDGDAAAMKTCCKEQGIDYIILSPDYLNILEEYKDAFNYDPQFFEDNLEVVARFPSEQITICRIPD